MAASSTFLKLLDEMADLHKRKNAGYAGDNPDWAANFRMSEEFGIPAQSGVITRMTDKWGRLKSLWLKADNNQVGESIEDTLIDLAAYALILVTIRREEAAENMVGTAVAPITGHNRYDPGQSGRW